MSSYSFTDLRDKILLWLHGRRLGVMGDAVLGSNNLLVLDGTAIGSTRSGPNALKVVAAGNNGAGAITITGAKVGDHVEMVLLSTFTDATSSFESTVSVAGQVQQTSASNLSGTTTRRCCDASTRRQRVSRVAPAPSPATATATTARTRSSPTATASSGSAAVSTRRTANATRARRATSTVSTRSATSRSRNTSSS